MGLWQSKKWFLAGCYSQSTAQTAEWDTHLSFYVGSLLAYSGVSAWEVWHISIGLQSFLSSSIGCGHHLGVLSLYCSSLPVSPRKKAYLLSFGVCHCHPRNTARLPGRQGLYLKSHRTTYIWVLLKAAAWGSGYWSQSKHFYDNLKLSPLDDLYTQFLHREHT